jgi:hypothetical protein
LLTSLQARQALRRAPKIYTYKERIISTTRAVTIRVDQFGIVSQIRPFNVKPSEVTGWVITRTDPPFAAPAPEHLPGKITLPAEKTSTNPTLSNTTIARRVYSNESLKTIGKTVTETLPSDITSDLPFNHKLGLIGCLKAIGKITRKIRAEDRYVIASRAELEDEEFDVVDSEGPSARNGTVKDPNAIGMEELANALRSAWDTYK